LDRLLSARIDLETQIAKQKKRVAALHELAETDEDAPAITGLVEGITDAVRTVFRAAEKPLNPAEVRSRVEALGLPPQKNLLASIHTVIKRLLEAGEIEGTGDPAFGGGYRQTARERFVQLHKARLARGRTVPTPQGSDPIEDFLGPVQRGEQPKEPRPQERFSLDHTRPTKAKQD
jgi:hypothetical protein